MAGCEILGHENVMIEWKDSTFSPSSLDSVFGECLVMNFHIFSDEIHSADFLSTRFQDIITPFHPAPLKRAEDTNIKRLHVMGGMGR